MKLKSKLVYAISVILGIIPVTVLVLIQSILALNAVYDSKLVIDGDEQNVIAIIAYDEYNNIMTNTILNSVDEDGQPILYSIREAGPDFLLIDYHGGKVENEEVNILGIQIILEDGYKSKLLTGVVYLKFENIPEGTYLADYIANMNTTYTTYFQEKTTMISVIIVKVVAASIGTILGIVTALLIILRKGTKALVKRYWRISIMVGLSEATIILGVISWIATDMFWVLGAITVGVGIFFGLEKLAMAKGYLDKPKVIIETQQAISLDLQQEVSNIIAKYRK